MGKLTDEEFRDFLKTCRELAEGPFEEMQREVEVTNKFPQEFIDLARENNLYRYALPEEYGGWGFTEKEILQVQEEFSRGPGGMRMHLHYAADLNWRILDDYGCDELKAAYMDKFADKTIFTCFALTEQTGGTGADVHTTAVKDADGNYILNGEKWLISHTDVAQFAYVIAVTDPEKQGDERLSAFFVPCDTPGYETTPMPHMMGARGAAHTGLKFTNMKLDKKYLLGEEGQGMEIAIHSLSVSRAHIAASNLGMCQRMLEMSLARANDRVTFGKPIATRQMIKREIAEMQTEAIVSAAINVWKEDDLHITPEIMVPLVSEVNELRFVKKVIKAKADELIEQSGLKMKYMVGTMIETPRAAVTAGDVAKEAEFFSFGTNDLTQMTYGFSRDDVGRILETYFDKKILESDPFARLDQNGVGRLIRFAVAEGKRTRPDIKLGICGEHGGDLSSVEFCHNVGLNYVSCSPFRVPIARLAAAQARVKELGLA